jgi:hypothetical protein
MVLKNEIDLVSISRDRRAVGSHSGNAPEENYE